jgi:hypothetical protein
MKTIYEVSEQDYGLNRQYGTFEDKAVAEAMCERVNAFNHDDDKKIGTKAEVRSHPVFEPGDPMFTVVVLYVIADDRYSFKEICPTMYEHWQGIDWMRECIDSGSRNGAFGCAGTSEEDALARLQRLHLLAVEADDAEERRKHRWD